MTFFVLLPAILVGAATLSGLAQQAFKHFIDLDTLAWHVTYAFLIWALVGWWLEAQPAPIAPTPPPAAVPTLVDSVAEILTPGTRDPEMLVPIAEIVVREASARRLDPLLVAAIIQVENPWLVPDTASYAGAVGIMQIMPFHAEGFGCSGPLDDAHTSICLGTGVFRAYLEEALHAALLRYNGCTRSRCAGYSTLVLRGLS